MRLLKKLHKWVGLLIGIQVLLWLLSGLVISLLDPAKVNGTQWTSLNTAESPTLGQSILLEPAELPAAQLKDALDIELTTRHGKPVYLVRQAAGETLLDATDGSIVSIDKARAEQLARRDFSGNGEIISVEYGMAPDLETRDSNGAYWKVNFSDRANTAIYIAASTGDILERRNSFWRVRDFFWMLHIMDYDERSDFNNPLLITFSAFSLLTVLAGILLLVIRIRRLIRMEIARRERKKGLRP